MVAIQIRNVPEDLRDILAQDAKARGQSLQQYLLEVLQQQAGAARNAEFIRTWEPIRGLETPSGEPADVVQLIEEGRRERDRRILGSLADELPS